LETVLAPALAVCSGINLEYLLSAAAVEVHGAGSKSSLNVVANVGVQQGTSGDLRAGLPSQMTEMHAPVRAHFVVDAPYARVEAMLQRRPPLLALIVNQWVMFVARDPTTGIVYRRDSNGQWIPQQQQQQQQLQQQQQQSSTISSTKSKRGERRERHSFLQHRIHGMSVVRRESLIYSLSTLSMLAAIIVPVHFYAPFAMNPYATLTAVCAGALALPVLAFSRRYLHGEPMFVRFAMLSSALLLGFNLVATAPSLLHALAGWSLFGFASTFLIGSYTQHATVRNNATFAFAA
jgi:hypothetical protein